ncbi:hypothetical protein Nepgr_025913 [Nepenthes gracilis]|uniref:Uncharacterized protein n=1 Tax=Nepenthes gracilis TaxID=150966 RepID=A0AAD3T6Y2_NEPGR|nr:hypothetical protein Nepgr_025913 [Nepenthes gracilis]
MEQGSEDNPSSISCDKGWRHMLGRGHEHDVIAYSFLIHGFWKAALLEHGFKIFNEKVLREEQIHEEELPCARTEEEQQLSDFENRIRTTANGIRAES